MELDVKEQTTKLQMEIAELTGQVQQLDDQVDQLQRGYNKQVAQLQQATSNLVIAKFKKQGALELLQSLDGKEPEK